MNQPDHTNQALIIAWVNNSLTQEQKAIFSKKYAQDSVFAAAADNASVLAGSASDFVAPPVPDWNKTQLFPAKNKSSWFQWQGFPALACALSAVAIVLVFTGLPNKDNGKLLTAQTPSNVDAEQLSSLVEEQVRVQVKQQREMYQEANQVLFKEYAQSLAAQQQQTSAELTQYLLTSSREARKQDFAELLQFINDQRIDDQRFYARQFSKLQDEIDGIGMGYSAVLPNSNSVSLKDE
jgi:biopolymer transport protein ExbD